MPHIVYPLQRMMIQACSWHQDLGLYLSSNTEQEISPNYPKTLKVMFFLVRLLSLGVKASYFLNLSLF